MLHVLYVIKLSGNPRQLMMEQIDNNFFNNLSVLRRAFGICKHIMRLRTRDKFINYADVEDLMQTAFERILTNLAEGFGLILTEDTFWPYFWITARNLYVNKQLRSIRETQANSVNKLSTQNLNYAPPTHLNVAICKAMKNSLSSRQRQCFFMRIKAGYTLEEIAEKLEISVETVRYEVKKACEIIAKSI